MQMATVSKHAAISLPTQKSLLKPVVPARNNQWFSVRTSTSPSEVDMTRGSESSVEEPPNFLENELHPHINQGRTQHRTWVYTCTPDNSCKRNRS